MLTVNRSKGNGEHTPPPLLSAIGSVLFSIERRGGRFTSGSTVDRCIIILSYPGALKYFLRPVVYDTAMQVLEVLEQKLPNEKWQRETFRKPAASERVKNKPLKTYQYLAKYSKKNDDNTLMPKLDIWQAFCCVYVPLMMALIMPWRL